MYHAYGILPKQLNEAASEVSKIVFFFCYTLWSPFDIVSASTGEYDKRYGFIYVDTTDEEVGTLDRYKKDSFYWYKKVIESNGEYLD